MVTYDAVVVGGGVAGSIAAREMGLRGLRVALLERSHHPRPKACGEGLLPHGVAALRAMGLAAPGIPVRGLRYVSPGGAIAVADFPSGEGLVVRREAFDAYLFAAAEGTPNVEAFPDTAYDAALWRSRWTVGADGLHSLFHDLPPFRTRRPKVPRVGLSTHVTGLDVVPDRVEVIFHEGGEVYVAPAGGGEALVACLYRQDRLPPGPSNRDRVAQTLRSLAALRGRVGEVAFTTPVLGAAPLGLRLDRIVAGNILLVGDAAGACDPVVGEGMSLAILSARSAAEAVSAGRPEDYARDHRRLSAGAEWLSRWILRASRHPRLADRMIGSLHRHPELFAKLIGIATGERRPADLTAGDLVRLVA